MDFYLQLSCKTKSSFVIFNLREKEREGGGDRSSTSWEKYAVISINIKIRPNGANKCILELALSFAVALHSC